MRSLLAVLILLGSQFIYAGPPKGAPVDPAAGEKKALESLAGKVKAKIVWSSSRIGNHDIFIMNGGGTEVRQITQGPKTDWFSRFSPDGQQIIFTRSKMDWTLEPEAQNPKLWDTWIIQADGTNEKLLIPNATWATWRPDGKTIVFARGGQVYQFTVAAAETLLLCDSKAVFGKEVVLQNPQMSPDGKYLALTLRGSLRETGIYDLEKKAWTKTGEGCQINWFPDGNKILWMSPTGNGGSEIYSMKIKAGQPEIADPAKAVVPFMDLPGRRSHEYFPQFSADGQWLVWAATQRGHDHDLADYEIYVWDAAAPPDQAVRLTFHTGNDRWPDIHLEP
jgi:Tol biopolymer transport system component